MSAQPKKLENQELKTADLGDSQQNVPSRSDCPRRAFRTSESKKCSLCSKVFTRAGDVKRHYSVHTGEKPYPCSDCPKRFAHLYNLTVHSRTHTGEKPYPCNYCKKHFRDSGDLKRHIRIHTGEKPYCCAICGSRFSQSSNLKLHAATHGPKKPNERFLFVDCGDCTTS